MKRTKVIVGIVAGAFVLCSILFIWLAGSGQQSILLGTLSAVNATAKLLPIHRDTKDVIETANAISHSVLAKDDISRRYLILLQNNYELRPTGGFLGQYAVATVKNGELTRLFIEDANLLDQRITAKISAPYPFKQMMGIKNWKFRDANFSPDFPTSVEHVKYFYRLSGGNADFDAVVAINAEVFNDALEITGPVTVPGYSATFTSEDGAWVLEEIVERAYLGDNVTAEAKQGRKDILKKLGAIMADELVSMNNIPRLVEFARTELEEKNIMLWFEDENLRALAEKAHWDGSVAQDWDGDYLMPVDANLGALKSDYYIRRSIDYTLDTTLEVPTATFVYTYKHTAPYGDWRTSDYHSYLRLYVPEGAELISREMVGSPITRLEFGKTYFGMKVDVLIGGETKAKIVYKLPDRFFDTEDYKLLIQKQSGAGEVPVRITLRTPEGEFTQEDTLLKDIAYTFEEEEY